MERNTVIVSRFCDGVSYYADSYYITIIISIFDLLYFACHPTEKSSIDEVKQFYKDHSSTVFYVVYGSFTQVEQTILDRGIYACAHPTSP